MSSRPAGNAAKRVVTTAPAPWKSWRITARHARCIRFIETYCIPPKGYGAGKTMKLGPFQKEWLEESLAPDVDAAAMELPRGNGKSTFLAGVATWAEFDDDGTGAPQVPIVATTINQAVRSVYGVALSMIRKHPDLRDRSLVYSAIGAQKVITPHNEGEMFPVSNDPDGLQGLDPSVAVCDEIGFMPIESWDSLLLASGKRPFSLVVGIGTPGFDRDNALWHLRVQVQTGAAPPSFSFTEYAADEGCDIRDEVQWHKANPALACGFMNIKALRTAVALSPEAHFRIFRLGQWVDGVESWLGADGLVLWQALTDPWEMQPGAPTWVGVDAARTRDSTAITWCQFREDGRLHVKTEIWQPRPDGRLDVTDAMRLLRELDAAYELRAIAYDPRYFELAAQVLDDEGLPMLEFPQSLERMTPAVGATYEAIKRHEISHEDDGAFERQVLDAVPRFNEAGFTLSKSKSKDRIDAAVSLCMAAHAALVAQDASVEVPELW